MQYTYLLVNFFTLLVPFLFSFHPKLQFHKTWYAFFPAVFFSGFIFVLWDMYFTSIGVWGFNEKYLTGIKVGNLPVEEVLFFFCIPYACVFTFHSLSKILPASKVSKMQKYLSLFFIMSLFTIGIIFIDRSYTAVTFVSLSSLLIFNQFVLKIKWLLNFYMVYAVLLIPFFIVNGILTGTGIEEEVVWYNASEFMGLRIGTVPVEDIFYGAELVLLNLLLYKTLIARKSTAPSAKKLQNKIS